jgi:hypothetical protein
MIDASAYRNSWPTPSNASKRCQHRAFRWPHVAHDLGAGVQKTTETNWHFAELLLCPEVVGTRHQAGPRRAEAIHGNSGFVVGRSALLEPVPSSQEAEKPSLRKETGGNSGGWECITVLVEVSGEDLEVWTTASLSANSWTTRPAQLTENKAIECGRRYRVRAAGVHGRGWPRNTWRRNADPASELNQRPEGPG